MKSDFENNIAISSTTAVGSKPRQMPNDALIDRICDWIEDNVDEKYIHFTLDGCQDPEILSYRITEDLRNYLKM